MAPASMVLGPMGFVALGPYNAYASEGSLRSMWSLHACVHGLGMGSGWDLRVCPTKSANLES